MHDATCGDCGKQCQVPFAPRGDKPVYCGECFQKHKPQNRGGSGGGIRSAKTANSLIKAGADGLVIGTLLEQTGGLKKFTEMVKSIQK